MTNFCPRILKVVCPNCSAIRTKLGGNYLTANIFESGPMSTNAMKMFGQLASHPKLLIWSKLSPG